MPMDSFVQSYDPFHNFVRGTHLRFSWLPNRCFYTNRSLWLKYAYVQVAMYTGPGEPAFEYRWYDKDEFLKRKITGEL